MKLAAIVLAGSAFIAAVIGARIWHRVNKMPILGTNEGAADLNRKAALLAAISVSLSLTATLVSILAN